MNKSLNQSTNLLDALDPETRKLVNQMDLLKVDESDEFSRPAISPRANKKKKRKNKNKADYQSNSFAVSEQVEETKDGPVTEFKYRSNVTVVPRQSFDVVKKKKNKMSKESDQKDDTLDYVH